MFTDIESRGTWKSLVGPLDAVSVAFKRSLEELQVCGLEGCRTITSMSVNTLTQLFQRYADVSAVRRVATNLLDNFNAVGVLLIVLDEVMIVSLITSVR
jgi:hypothetical protein